MCSVPSALLLRRTRSAVSTALRFSGRYRPPACCQTGFIRSATSLPLQRATGSSHPRRLRRELLSRGSRAPSAPALRVHSYGSLHDPLRSAFRLSQPLDGLRLAAPRSLISCYRHPWGSLPSGVFPLRGAAPRLRGRFPHAGSARRSSLPPTGPCSPRRIRWLWPGVYANQSPDPLVGFIPSRVLSLLAVGTPSRSLLPWALQRGLTVTLAATLRSITGRRAWLVSPETADPPGASHLAASGCR